MLALYMLLLCVRVSVRHSVCPSVCHKLALPKWLNTGSRKQCHTIPKTPGFADAKDLREIPTGSPSTGAPNRGGVGSNRRFSTNI